MSFERDYLLKAFNDACLARSLYHQNTLHALAKGSLPLAKWCQSQAQRWHDRAEHARRRFMEIL